MAVAEVLQAVDEEQSAREERESVEDDRRPEAHVRTVAVSGPARGFANGSFLLSRLYVDHVLDVTQGVSATF